MNATSLISGIVFMGAGGAFLKGGLDAKKTGTISVGTRGGPPTIYDRGKDPEGFNRQVRDVLLIGAAGHHRRSVAGARHSFRMKWTLGVLVVPR